MRCFSCVQRTIQAVHVCTGFHIIQIRLKLIRSNIPEVRTHTLVTTLVVLVRAVFAVIKQQNRWMRMLCDQKQDICYTGQYDICL